MFWVLYATQGIYAQDSLGVSKPKPVSVEDFVGNRRQCLQLMVHKTFEERKHLGLLSISAYAADYDNDKTKSEYLNTTLLYHRLCKGFGLHAGATFTSHEGWKPFVGLQYMLQRKAFSLIYLPSYYFLHSNKVSHIAVIEYKPTIHGRWAIYTRAQLHYSYDLEHKDHFRSYVYSRLGVSYGNVSFGLAHNLDRYGAAKNTKNNFGGFVKLNL